MTLAQQYDKQKQETANRFRERDAVNEVLADVRDLRGAALMFEVAEIVEDVIEDVEVYVKHYNKSLEYILGKIPAEVKETIIVRNG